MAKDEKRKEPGGDKVISGARIFGQVCEKVGGFALTFFTLTFITGLVSNGIADGKISYNKRKEGKNNG
jgi:hypothetical protein